WSSFVNDGSTQTRSFNNQNQLTGISGATTPTYDNNGNTKTDETAKALTYDAWNRLVQVVFGAATVTYAYDVLAHRISRSISSNPFPIDYIYSSDWQVIQEGLFGQAGTQYVWSPVYVDALVEQDWSGRWYMQQDANWNVTAVLDSNGSAS